MKLLPGVFVITYAAASYCGVALLVAFPTFVVSSALSAVFAWVYLRYAGGSALATVGWVVLLQIIVPLWILAVIGVASTNTFNEFLALWNKAASSAGGFGLGELVAPIAAALLGVLGCKLTSNKSLQPTAESGG